MYISIYTYIYTSIRCGHHYPALSTHRPQKRYSYTVDDIAWNHVFVPMVSESPTGVCEVDYGKLHTTRAMTREDEDDVAPVVAVI